MENYYTRTISLISKSKSLDRVLVAEADSPLYFLIEIRNPWFGASTFAYKLVQTVKEKYHQGALSAGQNFEETLREANEVLARITEEGQTDWLGNLSAIIFLIEDNKIILASVGNAGCFLIRDHNLIEITEDQPKETHPLKTFSNILNGELESEDKIIVANKDFFDNLSEDYLRQILSQETFREAAAGIAKSLQREKIRTANALVLEIKKGTFAAPLPTEDVIYLDQRKKIPVKLASRWLISLTNGAYSILAPALRRGFKILRKSAAKSVIKSASVIEKSTITIFSKISSSPVLRRIINKNRKWLMPTALGILILILLLGVFLISLRRQRSQEIQSQKKVVIQAEDKVRMGQMASDQGDKEAGRKFYLEALSLISDIKTKDSQSLSSKINSQLDKLNNVVRIKSPKTIFDFQAVSGEAMVSQVLVIDKKIYWVDSKTNQIYENDKKLIGLSQYSGRFVSAVYQEPEKLLITYQDLEGIYEYKIEENKLEKAKVIFDEPWKKAKLLANYFTNLYLLDPAEGQIYKYEKTAAGYSRAISYGDKNKVDLKKTVSLALDGYLYVLNSDGTVLKLLAGRPVADFGLKNIPAPDSQIKEPVKLFTSPETDNLYLLDGSRVLEFDKTGNYLRMLIFDLTNLKDLQINQKEKKLYLSDGSKVYEVGL